MSVDWRDGAPKMLTSITGPRDEPILTPVDRRWLWHLEAALSLSAPTGSTLHEVTDKLRNYLHETCEHHWLDYATCCEPPNEDCSPPHRQCLWCNEVEWADDGPAVSA